MLQQLSLAHFENRPGLGARVVEDKGLVNDWHQPACIGEASRVSATNVHIGHIVPALGYALADSLNASLRIVQTNVEKSGEEGSFQRRANRIARTGGAPDGNTLPVPKMDSDRAMDAAACIGCRACVAACPNASAALFTGAKISHLGLLPQGQAERSRRALRMVAQFNTELFGSCTNIGECEAVCPKEIRLDVIARMNHDYLKAKWEDRS